MRRAPLWMSICALAACKGTPSAPSDGGQSPGPAAAHDDAAPPPEGDRPRPAVGGGMGEGPPLGDPSGPAKPIFHVATVGTRPLHLVDVGARTFAYGGSFLGSVSADGVSFDPALSKGLDLVDWARWLGGLAGSWPDRVWLKVAGTNGRTGLSELFRWTGESWRRELATPLGEVVLGVSPWSEGRMLAMKTPSMFPFDATFVILEGKKGDRVPSPTPGRPGAKFCKVRVRPTAFGALATGHVFSAGTYCPDESEVSPEARPDWNGRIESWAPGAVVSRIEVLPPPPSGQGELTAVALRARSPRDVLIAGNVGEAPYLAHFDGDAWRYVPGPESAAPLTGIAVGNGGVLWLVTSRLDGHSWDKSTTGESSELWRWRGAGSGWEKIDMPAPPPDATQGVGFAPYDVALVDGEPWVSAVYASGEPDQAGFRPVKNALLRVRGGGPPFVVPEPEQIDRSVHPFRMPRPWEGDCKTPFALLYTLSKTAPKDYDYPTTRAALKGHVEFQAVSFIDFEQGGKRFFGAKVPDAATGRKLVALVKANVPGSTPQFVCHDPVAPRLVPIDLATGLLKRP